MSQPEDEQLKATHTELEKHVKKDKWENIGQLTVTDEKLNQMVDLSPLLKIRQIWFNRNNIGSIECLWGMRMPEIRKLSFSHNKLRRISVIRKITVPNLDQLQLDHNYFHGEDFLYQTKFVKDIMVWISYDSESSEVQWKYFNKCMNGRFKRLQIKMRE